MLFMPKEVKFFDLFDAQAALVLESASLFKKLVCANDITRDNVSKMHALEHEADEACHNIINTLNESFITPFDREDILDLTNQMDNIIDGIYLITNRFYLFKIKEPSQESKHLAELMEKAAIEVSQAVISLRSKKNLKKTIKHCVEINRLENLADDIRDEAISRILNDEKINPLMAIKQKELFEESEAVTDMCEHVANTISSILVKNN
ncbi:MAG: DUF47 family protein [Elusimicrobiaceae bacterium]|nr:DUF47 family protein [Elusimicrobiaceae bacterium]